MKIHVQLPESTFFSILFILSQSTDVPFSNFARAPVIHAASEFHSSSRQLAVRVARLMSRQVRDVRVTDDTGAGTR